MKNYYQIIYFPYLFIGEKTNLIKINDVKIWNFDKNKNKKYFLKNKTLINKVNKLIGQNKNQNKTIKGIGIVCINNKTISQFREHELAKINHIKLLLFISSISNNNIIYNNQYQNINWITSDNFDFIIQNFEIKNNYTSFQDGAIHSIASGGWEINEIVYQKPNFIHKPFNFSIDNYFLNEIQKLRNKDIKIYNRIIRSIEIFYESYRNSYHVSWYSRILLQIQAFEILFNLENRKDFKDKIERYCCEPEENKIHFKYEYKEEKIWESTNRPKKVMWADRFYTLRNHIIHGKKISNTAYCFEKQRHFDIGLMIFILSIKRLINKQYTKKIKFIDKIIYDQKNRIFMYK